MVVGKAGSSIWLQSIGVRDVLVGWGKESIRAVKWDIIAFTSLAR